MGSLNDYGRGESWNMEGQGRGRRLRWRLLRQCALAAIFFFAVASLIGNEGLLGEAARYVAGPGLAVESSWLARDEAMTPVQAAAEGTLGESGDRAQAGSSSEAGGAQQGSQGANGTEGGLAPDPNATPQFTAPASGVVVSDLAVTSAGFGSTQGILIQGSSGQRVRAAAAGLVKEVADEDGGFRLELSHSGGFTSIYRGLSQVEATVGDQVALGDPIGSCADGELNFSLLKDGQTVDPLEYLFN